MARIFKGTEGTILLNFKHFLDYTPDIHTVVLYTTDVENVVRIYTDIRCDDSFVEVVVRPTDFDNMEDGVISYILEGYDVRIERQSNNYLKTPISNPTTGIQLRKEENISDNGYYTVNPDRGYKGMAEVNIHVNVDTETPYYQGFEEGNVIGYETGMRVQKELLETLTVTENGTYTKEDGYNEIIVDVPDLNGDYQTGFDEGYSQGNQAGYDTGYMEGETAGYDSGFEIGKETGVNQAGEIIAETAQVLDITENGQYLTKYAEPYIPENITGIYPDGENFYSYAILNGVTFDTGIIPDENTTLEMWWNDKDVMIDQSEEFIIGIQPSYVNQIWKICYSKHVSSYRAEIAGSHINFQLNNIGWHHFKMSFADGFWVDGEKIGDFGTNVGLCTDTIKINGGYLVFADYQINSIFGMIKINDTVFIPTVKGFMNINTNEILPITHGGNYEYVEEKEIQAEGNLIKSVNVNVLPKIDVANENLTFGYSLLTEIPSYLYFSNVIDFSNMFRECTNLIITDDFTTQLKPIKLNYAFYNLQKMTKFPKINLEDVIDFSFAFYNWKNAEDTSECYNWYLPKCKSFTSSTRGWDKVSDWSFLSNWGITKDANIGDMISGDGAITVPAIENDASSANGNCIFSNSYSDKQKLTYFGGYIGRKASIDNNYHYVRMPNLSYESCKSILENLYDFNGNGETPTSSQGKLKVHPNFLTTIGDEISIATNKGWQVSA